MQISSGVIKGAQKVLIYGPEGIGKSTLAARFPDPLFIDTEGSTKHMDVKRLPFPTSWTMLMEEVAYVMLNPTCCKTLVIDTADWAEALCISHVCAKAQKNGIEDFGYGKGYTYLAEEFGNLLNRLTEVIESGVDVVFTAHAQIKKFEQPDEQAAYDRWELKLQKKTAPLLREWADMVLFVNYKTFVVKAEGTKTPKGAGGRERVAYSTHSAAWDAKNRHDLPDEFSIGNGKLLPKVLADAIAHDDTRQGRAETNAPAGETPTAESVAADLGAEIITAPGGDDRPARLKPLYDLMESAGVSEEDVRRAVADRGFFPIQTDVSVYPQDFVDGVLVGAWEKVLAHINELKSVPFK